MASHCVVPSCLGSAVNHPSVLQVRECHNSPRYFMITAICRGGKYRLCSSYPNLSGFSPASSSHWKISFSYSFIGRVSLMVCLNKDNEKYPYSSKLSMQKKCPIPGQISGAFENEGDRFRRVGRSVADDYLLFSHCAPFAKCPIPSLDKMGNIFWNQSIFQ